VKPAAGPRATAAQGAEEEGGGREPKARTEGGRSEEEGVL